MANEKKLDPSDSWGNFRRLMLIMMVAGVVAAGASLFWLHATDALSSLWLAIMVAIGVFLTVMLAGVLMGLVYASNRSGIDDAVDHHQRRDHERP